LLIHNLHKWALRKISGEPIESIYNSGRLFLLNKTESLFPSSFEARPIIILSPVRKYLEQLWYDKYKEILWKNIGPWQTGFRPGQNT